MMFSKTISSTSVLAALQFADGRKKAVASIKVPAAASREGEGSECLPRKKTWKRRLLSSKLGDTTGNMLDVGILSRCPPNEACEADATSSIGGRCVATVTHSTRRLEKERCYFSCPDPNFCECLDDQGYISHEDRECISTVASSCRNGDYVKCIPNLMDNNIDIRNNTITGWKEYSCPLYECIDDGETVDTCAADAIEEYFEFCTDYFLSKNDTSIYNRDTCGLIVEFFSILGPGYLQYMREPNKVAKEGQLIYQRFYECLSNHTGDGLDQYEHYQEDLDSALEQYYIQAYEHIEECRCQKYSEICQGGLKFGLDKQNPSYCLVSNCCNNTIPEGNMTACFDLARDPLEVTIATIAHELIATQLTAMPSASPSIKPSNILESEEEISLLDQIGHKQSSSGSTNSVGSLLGSVFWVPALVAVGMSIFILEQFMT